MLSPETKPIDTTTLLMELQTLLLKFEALFQPQHSLPPARSTDHHIHLLPQTTLVNVHPYWYPHFQKQKIELQVDTMLQKALFSLVQVCFCPWFCW